MFNKYFVEKTMTDPQIYYLISLCSFYKWETWDTTKSKILPMASHLVSDRAWIQTLFLFFMMQSVCRVIFLITSYRDIIRLPLPARSLLKFVKTTLLKFYVTLLYSFWYLSTYISLFVIYGFSVTVHSKGEACKVSFKEEDALGAIIKPDISGVLRLFYSSIWNFFCTLES